MKVRRKAILDVMLGPVVERFLEDIEIGEVDKTGPITVTAEEIISFAEKYDPLPMHISENEGRATIHSSLIASGVLTIALKQRMIMSIERNAAIIGAAKVEKITFHKPVRPGDDLKMRRTCLNKRESRSRLDRGLVTWDFQITNQKGEEVLSSRDIIMIRRKATEPDKL